LKGKPAHLAPRPQPTTVSQRDGRRDHNECGKRTQNRLTIAMPIPPARGLPETQLSSFEARALRGSHISRWRRREPRRCAGSCRPPSPSRHTLIKLGERMSPLLVVKVLVGHVDFGDVICWRHECLGQLTHRYQRRLQHRLDSDGSIGGSKSLARPGERHRPGKL
jgi:hypothetical protein